MSKLFTTKKKISFTLNPYELEALARFAEHEKRKLSNAAKSIVMRYLRSFENEYKNKEND